MNIKASVPLSASRAATTWPACFANTRPPLAGLEALFAMPCMHLPFRAQGAHLDRFSAGKVKFSAPLSIKSRGGLPQRRQALGCLLGLSSCA